MVMDYVPQIAEEMWTDEATLKILPLTARFLLPETTEAVRYFERIR